MLLLLLLLVFSSVFISMSFHGRIWRLVHTCDINANANANANGMQASWYVQSKHKEREIRKHSRSIFTRWSTMIELLPIHTCGKRTQIHSLFLALTLAFAFALALGWFAMKVRRMFEFNVFRQRVFVSLKRTLCHQSLRSFKL